METLIKNMTPGSQVCVLIKSEDGLQYKEGQIVKVGAPRVEAPANNGGFSLELPKYRQVVDVTFTVDGKSVTEAADVSATMLQTTQLGGLALVATDKSTIVQELHATRKASADYVKQAETEVPRQQKRVEECDVLIAELDTAFRQQQETEQRFSRIEKKQEEFGGMLERILKAVEKP